MMWPFTQPTSKLEYQVATEADIAEVIEQFVDAADRCMRAGFDGIELHAGHGYLIDEFLDAVDEQAHRRLGRLVSRAGRGC